MNGIDSKNYGEFFEKLASDKTEIVLVKESLDKFDLKYFEIVNYKNNEVKIQFFPINIKNKDIKYYSFAKFAAYFSWYEKVFALLLYIFLIVLFTRGLWETFRKAGRNSNLSIIPIIRFIEIGKILELPKWQIFILCIPLIRMVLSYHISIKTCKAYGLKGNLLKGVGIIFPGILWTYIGLNYNVKYLG